MNDKLLLIDLTDTAKKSLKKDAGGGDVGEYVQSRLDNNLYDIQLFKYKSLAKPDDWEVALPMEGGWILLLEPDKEGGYFRCIGARRNSVSIDPGSDSYYQLPNRSRCKVLIPKRDPSVYQENSLDCQNIYSEVGKKKCSDFPPSEMRKWETYLKLYKKDIDKKKIEFSIENIKIERRKIQATIKPLNQDDLKKIKGMGGEEIDLLSEPSSDTLLACGKFKPLKNNKLVIELDKKYSSFLKDLVSDLDLEVDGTGVLLDPSKEVGDNKKEEVFYLNDEPFMNAMASLDESKDKDSQVRNYRIDLQSVKIKQLHCEFNFGGELYQIKVMKRGLKNIENKPIWDVLSGDRVAKLPGEFAEIDNPRLNDEQKQAIKGALASRELFLIWGPPGTGKTEVIKEIAKAEALEGRKTLICSQANLAVDNALARLCDESGLYPFRIAKEGYQMEGEDEDKVAYEQTSPQFFLKIYEKGIKDKNDSPAVDDKWEIGLRKQLLNEIKSSKKRLSKKDRDDFEDREFRQFAELYKKRINVVGSTLMESGKGKWVSKGKGSKSTYKNKLLNTTGIKKFHTVIIDEVSKATPPELFIPVSLGERLILVGDHKQLPPMFKMLSGDDQTQEEWAKDLGVEADQLDGDDTIFERLWERHGKEASSSRAMLTKQYRMHPKIEGLIKPFYTTAKGSLTCGLTDAEKEKLLLSGKDNFFKPTVWVDSGISRERKSGTSFYNPDEIDKVGEILNKLARFEDKAISVGVITFYGAQLQKLREKYENRYTPKFGKGKLIFGTVDRFQGRECDVIICSLVRNNNNRNIGFASKPNRINVAFSRARRSLIIVGGTDTFCYTESNEGAREIYSKIYDQCHRAKPKELADE